MNMEINIAFFRWVFLPLFFCASTTLTSLAQEQLPIRIFGTDDPLTPLPGPAVTHIMQDSDGVIWMLIFGKGLVRFDGKEMRENHKLRVCAGK